MRFSNFKTAIYEQKTNFVYKFICSLNKPKQFTLLICIRTKERIALEEAMKRRSSTKLREAR